MAIHAIAFIISSHRSNHIGHQTSCSISMRKFTESIRNYSSIILFITTANYEIIIAIQTNGHRKHEIIDTICIWLIKMNILWWNIWNQCIDKLCNCNAYTNTIQMHEFTLFLHFINYSYVLMRNVSVTVQLSFICEKYNKNKQRYYRSFEIIFNGSLCKQGALGWN